jgi:hypothetical protein
MTEELTLVTLWSIAPSNANPNGGDLWGFECDHGGCGLVARACFSVARPMLTTLSAMSPT